MVEIAARISEIYNVNVDFYLRALNHIELGFEVSTGNGTLVYDLNVRRYFQIFHAHSGRMQFISGKYNHYFWFMFQTDLFRVSIKSTMD